MIRNFVRDIFQVIHNVDFKFRKLLRNTFHGFAETEVELSSSPNLFAQHTLHICVMVVLFSSAGECAGSNGSLYDDAPHSNSHVLISQVKELISVFLVCVKLFLFTYFLFSFKTITP